MASIEILAAPASNFAGTSRRNSGHFKLVPPTKAQRELIRTRIESAAEKLDKARPLGKDSMEAIARQILSELGQPEGFLGWSMVGLATAFWRDQVGAVPPQRRLCLLPHCPEHAQGCPAEYGPVGPRHQDCGACRMADFRGLAEQMGYQVLMAENTSSVLKTIVSGQVDAIVGVAGLHVLEKAIDKILLAGIPCMAVPLVTSDGREPAVDEDWVTTMIKTECRPAETQTRSYLHLMREAARMFEPAELERLAPRLRGTTQPKSAEGQRVCRLEPIEATEAIAYDFLSRGGKHSRPFITLAVYDALTGGGATTPAGPQLMAQWPDAVRRAALSIETFHKASLVHDDIEDDDLFRYGDQTLHRQYGIPTAINVGDYLIGLGYRLVSREAGQLGAVAAAEMVDRLADAHMKLAEGQGAELVWRDSRAKRLSVRDALKIYALKTAPAFEAALLVGLRMVRPLDTYLEPMCQFARNLGVAFQILNDLADWREDDFNKMLSGGDIVGGRPTILWALALEALPEVDRQRLETLCAQPECTPDTLGRVRQLYHQAGVFEQAARLVDKYQARAEAIAEEVQPDELRRLLYFLVDTVLERGAEIAPAVVVSPLVSHSLPAAAPQ